MNRSKVYTNGHYSSGRSTHRTNRHVDSAILPGKVRQPIQAYVPQRQSGQANGRYQVDSALDMPARKK